MDLTEDWLCTTLHLHLYCAKFFNLLYPLIPIASTIFSINFPLSLPFGILTSDVPWIIVFRSHSCLKYGLLVSFFLNSVYISKGYEIFSLHCVNSYKLVGRKCSQSTQEIT